MAEKSEIRLTRGQVSIVDAMDARELSWFKWHVTTRKNRNQQYATRNAVQESGKRGRIYMHNQIMKPVAGQLVDHINGNGLDNRRENLRICVSNQNCTNTKPYSNNTSGYRGVTWNTGMDKWMVQIRHNGKRMTLGYFEHDQLEVAARCYDRKARELHGEFASLNFPEAKNA